MQDETFHAYMNSLFDACRSEYMAHLEDLKHRLDRNHLNRLEQAFDFFDVDQDGALDMQEFLDIGQARLYRTTT